MIEPGLVSSIGAVVAHMSLSQAILQGASLVAHNTYGTYEFNAATGAVVAADVLGSALLAIGPPRVYTAVLDIWPLTGLDAMNPITGRLGTVMSIAVEMNDDHGCTREEIASWIESLELKLEAGRDLV